MFKPFVVSLGELSLPIYSSVVYVQHLKYERQIAFAKSRRDLFYLVIQNNRPNLTDGKFGNVCYYEEYRCINRIRWKHRKYSVIPNFFSYKKFVLRSETRFFCKKFDSLHSTKTSLIGRCFHRLRCKKKFAFA